MNSNNQLNLEEKFYQDCDKLNNIIKEANAEIIKAYSLVEDEIIKVLNADLKENKIRRARTSDASMPDFYHYIDVFKRIKNSDISKYSNTSAVTLITLHFTKNESAALTTITDIMTKVKKLLVNDYLTLLQNILNYASITIDTYLQLHSNFIIPLRKLNNLEYLIPNLQKYDNQK